MSKIDSKPKFPCGVVPEEISIPNVGTKCFEASVAGLFLNRTLLHTCYCSGGRKSDSQRVPTEAPWVSPNEFECIFDNQRDGIGDKTLLLNPTESVHFAENRTIGDSGLFNPLQHRAHGTGFFVLSEGDLDEKLSCMGAWGEARIINFRKKAFDHDVD